ncbi:hypothetical protein FE257_009776 [Aspergillus nanangensis]|uniref:USP domain-containing protein n=1 Tax=Aspergillus nanangensis TaxID=2582783 RepID=A0AAD4GTR2_ASPNN|nr:hypothetical protein FE257_009776 [Aspergillus nanangensis]
MITSDTIRVDEAKALDTGIYNLYAIIFHKGTSVYYGHYTAAVRCPDGTWAVLNDDEPVQRASNLEGVKKIMGDSFSSDAYLVAYQRLEDTADMVLEDLKTPDDTDGGDVRVELEGTIDLLGRDIGWNFGKQLILGPDAGPLIDLKPRAKVQHAKIQIKLTAWGNGDVLEGEITMSLKPGTAQSAFPETPGEMMDTEEDSLPDTRQNPGDLARDDSPPSWGRGSTASISSTDSLFNDMSTKKAISRAASQDSSPGKKPQGVRKSKRINKGAKKLSSYPASPEVSRHDDHFASLSTPLVQNQSHFSHQLGKIKPLMLTLHCLFPNELLLALDILDRGLVKRFVREAEHTINAISGDDPHAHSATSSPHEEPIVTAMDSMGDIFFVISTSSTPALSTVASPPKPFEQKGYEVRLQSWNCTCPSFALAAFRDLGPDPGTEDEHREYATAQHSHGISRYLFGGTLTRGSTRLSPPVCKHLLACFLTVRCPRMFGSVDQRAVVCTEGLAGCGAGWGG